MIDMVSKKKCPKCPWCQRRRTVEVVLTTVTQNLILPVLVCTRCGSITVRASARAELGMRISEIPEK